MGEARRRKKEPFPENPSERAHQKHRAAADAERNGPPSWRALEGALLIALSVRERRNEMREKNCYNF